MPRTKLTKKVANKRNRNSTIDELRVNAIGEVDRGEKNISFILSSEIIFRFRKAINLQYMHTNIYVFPRIQKWRPSLSTLLSNKSRNAIKFVIISTISDQNCRLIFWL